MELGARQSLQFFKQITWFLREILNHREDNQRLSS